MRCVTLATAVAFSLLAVPLAAAAGCQKGLASAPFIGAADMRAIDRAADHLPAHRPGLLHLSVGAAVPRSLARKPLPAAVARILPQYKGAGYTAFRVGKRLVIVNPHGILTYIMPIGPVTNPGNCP
ncbi:exported protein of unknown function [Beijerinckiaceae bacterium RH AL1]|nr:hypothetical protein [Beijerinckiaceae bacterium]VVB44631.1 exported protein of unknown function [Beijerinckiaceae bacterium RH CH11]VVB44709.1 exported protein of unknown function [Beijerinckiaceae bacterium RH AL8]VVC54456.1 exported protein of unknown function [Beijerinckiaceae bacterium RH AL1]